MDFTALDISTLFTLENLIVILIGTFVGLLFGAIPGLGIMITIVLLLPFSYMLTPIAAVLLLLAAYQGAEYGGSISSIVLGIPGNAAAAATVIDGNQMAKKKSPGKALGYSLFASVIGGIAGALMLIFLAQPISKVSLKLSSPEYFLIGMLGLLAVAAIGSKSAVKSVTAIILGLMVGTIGMDLFTGTQRFTMGRLELLEGIDTIAVIVGVFAFSEIFSMINEGLNKRYTENKKENISTKLTVKEIKGVSKPIGAGSLIGVIIGVIPGLGSAASAWFSYTFAKKFSKKPQEFGNGSAEGIAAPEAANNAAVGGALLPLLTLGIPGSPVVAVIMSAFIIHGIQPGPKVFSSNPDLINGILIGFLFTTIILYFMGRLLSNAFARVLTVPNSVLVPSIIILSLIGVYATNGHYFEVLLSFIIGLLAYLAKKLDFSLPAFILAFVLCPIIEENLRRTLLVNDGSYSVFLSRPISLTLLLILAGVICYMVYPSIKKFIYSGKTECKEEETIPTTNE